MISDRKHTSHQFYCHSSVRMPELDDGSVALTVTSPPYWNSIDYDLHSGDNNQWYRTRQYREGFQEYEEYLDFCKGVFTEVLRVTKPGGFCAVVIGTVLFKSKHYPVPYDLTARLEEIGWDFHQDIIWHKTTAGVKRAGTVIQKPYPGYYYPNIMTEYILIFRKPGEQIYRDSNNNREASQIPIDEVFKKETANNIWHIAPVPPGVINHPCPFPEEIPHRLISLYSYKGDIVLDPFLGSGQTSKVAISMGRRAAGYDTMKDYLELAEQRMSEPSKIRHLQLTAEFQKIPHSLEALPSNKPESDQIRLFRESTPESSKSK